VVVTATRGSVISEQEAGHTTVIDERQIRESGARSLAEILENQAAVRIASTTGDRSRGVISLRGFGENANARTLILIDGRPMNRPDMEGVNLQEIPLARIARVEVLRGSQTARFGDNAVGGVVNIVTTRGQEQVASRLETALGSNDWTMGRFNHSAAAGALRFTVDGEANFDGGWRDNSQSESRMLQFGLSRSWNEKVHIHSSFSLGEQEGRFPGPLSTQQFRNNPQQSIYSGIFAEQYGSQQTSYRADVSLQLDDTMLGQIEIPVSWNRRDLSWNMGPGSHADNLLDSIAVTPTVRQNGGRWTTEQGVDLRADFMDVTLFRDFARQRPRSNAELERTTLSVFASLDGQVREHWNMQMAARAGWTDVAAKLRDVRRPSDPLLNFDQSQNETNAAFQWGVRWQPEADIAAWLRYDWLYRLPSMDEIAAYQGFPLSQPFNAQLEAETGHNIELGGEWTAAPWRLRANAFAQFLDGEILYDFTKNLNVNFANTRRLGGELEARYDWEKCSLSMNYSAVDARFTNGAYAGNQVPLVPSQMVTSAWEYRPQEAFLLRVEHQWQGSSPEGNDFSGQQGDLPAFQVTNLTFRHQLATGFAWYLRVNNLWDHHYATLKYNGVWFPAAGRQFQVGMQYEF
jgi:iron complex outermembrane recepter protein